MKQQQKKFDLAAKSIFSLSALLSLTLTACTQNGRQGIDPQVEVQAPAAVKDSFDVQLAEQQLAVGGNQSQVTIKKSSLDKEFLLMGSVIVQQPIPSFTGIKSRVVAFKEVNSKLFLLDANSGHQITSNLPMNLLLTEFPILNENATSITFDFNAGMSKIFTQGDWFAEDEGSSGYKYDLPHAAVVSSFINSARVSSKSNILEIEQIAQINVKGGSGDLEDGPSGSSNAVPVMARYYLTPYTPDKNFVPSQNQPDGMKTFGYFEVAPQLTTDGSSFIRVSKWDVNAPIVYAVSANTPVDFRQPIADAVLYWNKFFGKNVMQVVQLSDKSITAPDPDYNIIQWVENDSAGSAYADAQMDPRSGQILHAQIYLTSVFGSLGKVRAEREFRDNPTSGTHITLKGFEAQPLCDYESGKALATLASTLSGTTLTDAQTLKLAQDYVRETVAHEVGHTLGLRHNFAGNLGANFALSERKNIYTQYLKNGKTTDDIRTTSSIMDYEMFEESTLMGDQISRNVGDLAYDRLAIRHLYFGDAPASVPAFCTDTDVGKYQDCQTFDTGKSLIEGSMWSVKNALDTAAITLMNTYISAKVPVSLSTQSLSPDKVPLNPLGAALITVAPRFLMYRALTKGGGLVAVRSSYPFISSLNSIQEKAAEADYITKAAPSGKLTSVFPMVDDKFSSQSYAQFSKLLDAPGYGSGTYNGKAYQFTAAEKTVMRTNAKLYFDRMQELLITDDIITFSGNPLPKDGAAQKSSDDDSDSSSSKVSPVMTELSESVLKAITDRIDKYVFSTTGEMIKTTITVEATEKNPKPKPVAVEFPKFSYSYKIRLAAAQLLAKSHSENVAWAAPERSRYVDEMTNEMLDALGGKDTDTINPGSLPNEAAQWLYENQAILSALKGADGN